MARTYQTQAGDMLDYIAWKVLGHHRLAVEAMFEANRDLSTYPPELPGGLTIIIPDIEAPTAPKFVKLWD